MQDNGLNKGLLDAYGGHRACHGQVSIDDSNELRVRSERFACSRHSTDVTLRLSGKAMYLALELTPLQAVVLARALDVAARTAQAVDALVAEQVAARAAHADKAAGGAL